MKTPRINSKWQDAYLRYRELEKELFDANGYEKNQIPLLRKTISGRKNFENYLRDEYLKIANSPGVKHLPNPTLAFLEELRYFADLQSDYDRVASNYLYDDVYHIAFDRLDTWRRYGEEIPPAERRRYGERIRPVKKYHWLYRGQVKDSWPVSPAILRESSKVTIKLDKLQKTQEAAKKACHLGHAIAAKQKITFEDAIAIAQHYSPELETPTWLVDFSRDPWVALFFASDGGNTGDCGIVWSINIDEYKDRTVGQENPIGPLHLVVPENIKRIKNQAGVFVNAIHLELFDQYVAFGWDTRFKQHTGLTFEDPVLGIGRNNIYPSKDCTKTILENIRLSVIDCDCDCDNTMNTCKVPSILFADTVDPNTYQKILESWFRGIQANNPSLTKTTTLANYITQLAQFHAALNTNSNAKNLPRIGRSFNRLFSALGVLCNAENRKQLIIFREVIRDKYLDNGIIDKEHRRVMEEIFNEMFPISEGYN